MPRPKTQPGTNTIDAAEVVDLGDGRMRIQWRVCLPNGQVKRCKTVMKTKSKTEIRRKAHVQAEAMINGMSTGSWKPTSDFAKYVEAESIPAIERNQFPRALRPNTQERYIHVLHLLANQMRGLTIADATRPRTLSDALAAIATENGTATAKQCSKVTSKYVMRRLVTDEVITHNPLRDMELELPKHVAKVKPKGGQALTAEERARVIDWLLAYKPEAEPKPKRGRYTAKQRTAIRERAVEITLLQAETGLRINEACNLRRCDVDISANPLTVTVTPEISKTHRGRTVPVMDARVADRIRMRLSEAPQGTTALVYGAPALPERVWDASNRQKAVKALYREIAGALDIPLLREVSSHVWRATLNTEWMQRGVPDALRAAFFGHGEDVNRASYTDTSGTEALVRMLGDNASKTTSVSKGNQGVKPGNQG